MPRPQLHLASHPADRAPRVSAATPTHDAIGRPLICLQTLGAATILIGGTPLTLTSETLFSLLLRLASAPDMRVNRDELLATLWPGQPDARRRANLRQTLYKLRGVGVDISMRETTVELDASQVVRTFSITRTMEAYERDVMLGREPFGTYLPGLSAPWATLQSWIDDERQAVHADIRRVLSEQLRRHREKSDWTWVESLSRDLLQFDALNEQATLAIAECTALTGSKAEALGILDRYLAELGPLAGDIRLPATLLRRRIAEPAGRGRMSFAPTERHFVGRDTELADLTHAMRRARWHDGSAVLLHGTAGIGKTRLTTELEKLAPAEDVQVIRLACREGDSARTLSMFIDVLPDLLHRSGAERVSPDSMITLRQLGVAASPSVVRELAPPAYEMRESRSTVAIRRAIVDLIAALSESRPITLMVEDVHWIDEPSWDLLCDLTDRLSSMCCFVLMTSREPHARPERPHRIPAGLTVRRLPPLTRDQSAQLARAISVDLSATVTEEINEWFLRASEGIPLFLRSLVNYWIETGNAGGVPPTLLGVIDQRLTQLSGDALRVLQAAAFLGRWATIDRVTRVLELRATEMLHSLEQIESMGAFSSNAGHGLTTHELIGRAARARLSPLLLHALHRRTAEVLLAESRSLPNAELVLEALDHIAGSGDSDWLATETVGVLEQIADVGVPERALVALRRLKTDALSAADRANVSAATARLLALAGDYSGALKQQPERRALPHVTEFLSDTDAGAALSLADSLYRADQEADRAEIIRFTVAVAEASHLSRATRLRAADVGLIMISNECDEALAQRIFEAVAPSATEIEEDDTCRRFAIVYHTQFGDRATAAEIAEVLFARAQRAQPSASAYQEAMRAGFSLRIVDPGSRHLAALELAVRISESASVPSLGINAAWHLGQSYLERGDAVNLARSLEQLRTLLSRVEDPIVCNYVQALFCREAIERRDVREARSYLDAFRSHLPRRQTLKSSSHLHSLEIAVAMLDDFWTPSDHDVKILLERLALVGKYGTSDFLACTTAEALSRTGEIEQGKKLLTEFVRFQRREVGAPSARIASVLANMAAMA